MRSEGERINLEKIICNYIKCKERGNRGRCYTQLFYRKCLIYKNWKVNSIPTEYEEMEETDSDGNITIITRPKWE